MLIVEVARGDTDFIRDTLEGEIDFDSMARSLVASIGEDEAMIAGLKTYSDDLSARKDRIAVRIQVKRALMASALAIASPMPLPITATFLSRPSKPSQTGQ